jgi:hypothetical protein
MPICDACGNDYPRAFQIVTAEGRRLIADSVECAAHLIAPTCAHCGCRILGHGIETADAIYCCAACSRHDGKTGAVDNTAKTARREIHG